MFKSKDILVRGFNWCEQPIKVSIDSLTRNMLCKKHNNLLSPLDSAASYAFDILREQNRLHNERQKYPYQKYKRVCYSMNATLLERWLLKTLINITYGSKFFVGPNGTQEGFPPDDLIKIAFGYNKFPKENGLFIAAKIGLGLHFTDSIRFISLNKDDKYIYGACFVFKGILMFLDLVPGGMKVPFEDIPGMDRDWHNARPMKRFRQIKFELNNRVHQTIDFKWSD